ncbi:hypothetical protein [Lentilactobacillus kisonensis]|uniref:hypothetical protein n=1 Tax=Lentilactobacillus kisonensis TaxID=481722 RepID=UPI0034E2B590
MDSERKDDTTMKRTSFWIIFLVSLCCISIVVLIQPVINSYFGNNTAIPYTILVIILSLCAGVITSTINNKFNKKIARVI